MGFLHEAKHSAGRGGRSCSLNCICVIMFSLPVLPPHGMAQPGERISCAEDHRSERLRELHQASACKQVSKAFTA